METVRKPVEHYERIRTR